MIFSPCRALARGHGRCKVPPRVIPETKSRPGFVCFGIRYTGNHIAQVCVTEMASAAVASKGAARVGRMPAADDHDYLHRFQCIDSKERGR